MTLEENELEADKCPECNKPLKHMSNDYTDSLYMCFTHGLMRKIKNDA